MLFGDRLHFVAALCAILFVSSVRAESLSWPTAVAEARTSSPDLMAARSALESARAALRIVEGDYKPNISAIAKVAEEGGDNPGATLSTYGLQADIPIFSGFSTRSAQLAQRRTVEQQEANLASAETVVRFNLRLAFSNVLNAHNGLILDHLISERLNQNGRFVRLRYEGGIEARWASEKADADAADALWQIGQSERALEAARQRLAQVLGRPNAGDLNVEGSLVAPPPPSDIANLIASIPQSHPDARSLRAASESSFETIRGAESGHWPTLTGNANYLQNGIDSWPDSDLWTVGAGLTFPLYSGGKTMASVDQASSTYRQAMASLRSKELQLKSDLISSHADYSSAVAKIPVSAATLKAAEERAKTIYAQYSAGLKGYLDWDQSQTLLTSAQRSDLQAKVQTLQTQALWEKSIGKDLSEP